MTNQWTFEELGLAHELEKISEERIALEAQHRLLNEMLNEFYRKDDYDSEMVNYLQAKQKSYWSKLNIIWDIKRYLGRLEKGYPFHVSYRTGHYMKKFGLPADQAELLADVHTKHLSSFEQYSDQWKKRIRGHIEKVEWEEEEDCFHVHYDDGEWYHYNRRGEWW